MPGGGPLLGRVGRAVALVGALVMLVAAVWASTRGPGGADGGWGFVAAWAIGLGVIVLGGLFVLVGRVTR